MVLVDTSIWIDHLRKADAKLIQLLDGQQVLMHPYIIGELACGSLNPRSEVLNLLSVLPSARLADAHEVLYFIEANQLFGKGIGYVDAHLLASVALERHATLWTRDKRLLALAKDIHLAYVPSE